MVEKAWEKPEREEEESRAERKRNPLEETGEEREKERRDFFGRKKNAESKREVVERKETVFRNQT